MGPFTQEDPIGIAGGLNLYGYANGDPINFSDPFGLSPCLANPRACGLLVRSAAAVNPVVGGLVAGGLAVGTLVSPEGREVAGNAVASVGGRIRAWVTGAMIWLGGGKPEDRRDRELERDQGREQIELPENPAPDPETEDEPTGGGG